MPSITTFDSQQPGAVPDARLKAVHSAGLSTTASESLSKGREVGALAGVLIIAKDSESVEQNEP